jgi:hypothetical protein
MKYFKKPDWMRSKDEAEQADNVESVFEVFELYKVDGSNEEAFKGRFKKGEIVSASEIRQFIMNYVKENNLQNPANPRFDLKISLSFFKSNV